ncbi:MAG: hypothetical protein IRZ09_11650 [Variibacter sp.]|nr:hypothetical protein [Variibacter sp.]
MSARATRARRAALNAGGLTLLSFAALAAVAVAATETLTTARFIPAAPMALPDYLTPAIDEASGNTFHRVTYPGAMGAGVICGPDYCTHRYSSAQAWNADQSLLVIINGCNGYCFLDGQTYLPLFRRSWSRECEWHPDDPEAMICVGGRAISLWAPRSDRDEVIYTAANHQRLQFGPNKGNPSRDGRRIVVRATADNGAQVAFAYDIAARRKFPDIHLADLPGKNDMCTISPAGAHVLCSQNLTNGTDQAFVFTVDGVRVQSWTEHHRPGHGDMTVDADGNEVYVGISKAVPDMYQIIKRRLTDGFVTALAPYGTAQHASLRALRRPDWVILSYAGSPDTVVRYPHWAPFAREVVALRIDGSGEFRRIAHTRNAPHDYWSETHASPSPNGSQIIWSSNWDQPGGPVSDFVTRLRW